MSVEDQEWMRRLLGERLEGEEMLDYAKELVAFAIDSEWASVQLECLPIDPEAKGPNARLSFLIDGEREAFNGGRMDYATGMRLAAALFDLGSDAGEESRDPFEPELFCEGVGEFVCLPSGRAARLKVSSTPLVCQGSHEAAALLALRASSMSLEGNLRLTAMWESHVLSTICETDPAAPAKKRSSRL